MLRKILVAAARFLMVPFSLSAQTTLRQALELATDRPALNQLVFNGLFQPGNQWLPPKQPVLRQGPSRFPGTNDW